MQSSDRLGSSNLPELFDISVFAVSCRGHISKGLANSRIPGASGSGVIFFQKGGPRTSPPDITAKYHNLRYRDSQEGTFDFGTPQLLLLAHELFCVQ